MSGRHQPENGADSQAVNPPDCCQACVCSEPHGDYLERLIDLRRQNKRLLGRIHRLEAQKERLSPDAPAALAGSSLGRAADTDDSTVVTGYVNPDGSGEGNWSAVTPPTGSQPVDTDIEPADQPLDSFLADAGLAFDDIPVAMAIHHRALAAERQVGAASAASGGLDVERGKPCDPPTTHRYVRVGPYVVRCRRCGYERAG